MRFLYSQFQDLNRLLKIDPICMASWIYIRAATWPSSHLIFPSHCQIDFLAYNEMCYTWMENQFGCVVYKTGNCLVAWLDAVRVQLNTQTGIIWEFVYWSLCSEKKFHSASRNWWPAVIQRASKGSEVQNDRWRHVPQHSHCDTFSLPYCIWKKSRHL